MTIPVPMQRELGMVQGDELEFAIDNGKVIEAYVLKAVPVELLPDDVLESLKKRKASQPPTQKLSGEQVKHRAQEKREAVRKPAQAFAGD
jgi:bifunctional DNA-binding transcriptional regulator/antitoxin component of YhaV-PrlF toxin-antitoxin module